MTEASTFVTYRQHSGLANRLRLHVIAHAYALHTGRTLVTHWRRNDECHARFGDLFEDDGSRSLRGLGPVDTLRFAAGWALSRSVITSELAPAPTPVAEFPTFGSRVVSFASSFRAAVAKGDRLGAYRDRVVSALRPRPDILAAVDDFLADVPRPRIGLHVRLGDFTALFGDDLPPLERFLEIGRALRTAVPDATFVVVSDGAPDRLAPLVDALGARTRDPERSRRTVSGIRDALTDLWVLSETDLVVGTPFSSFSGFAAFRSGVPRLQATAAWRENVDAALEAMHAD